MEPMFREVPNEALLLEFPPQPGTAYRDLYLSLASEATVLRGELAEARRELRCVRADVFCKGVLAGMALLAVMQWVVA